LSYPAYQQTNKQIDKHGSKHYSLKLWRM